MVAPPLQRREHVNVVVPTGLQIDFVHLGTTSQYYAVPWHFPEPQTLQLFQRWKVRRMARLVRQRITAGGNGCLGKFKRSREDRLVDRQILVRVFGT